MAGSPITRLAPYPPEGPRAALVIATTRYRDPELRQLRAPARDAEDLAEVLGDPDIGAFTVMRVIDGDERQVRREIDLFLSGRGIGDLVVVYLSCHGVLDRRNRLFFAAADTLKAQLGSTGIPSVWVLEQLEECRARSKVLILDCCFSGAFAHGSKGDADLDLERRLAGHGRGQAVLTASRAGEYSFEGQALPGAAITGSIFTAGLVEGLRTGAADVGGTGYVSVDEAYEYAYAYVVRSGASQTPQRWLSGGEGAIALARSPAGITVRPAPMPEALETSLNSQYPAVRIGAVNVLGEWLTGADLARALTAEQKLRQIAETDAPAVAAAARTYLRSPQRTDMAPRRPKPEFRAAEAARTQPPRREADIHTPREPATAQRQQQVGQPPSPDVRPSPDHAEVDLGSAAGVTDRGLRQQRNEDAMGLATEQTPDGLMVLAVVCDGVSASARPDDASQAAVQAALPVLMAAAREGADPAAASLEAVAAARGSVAEITGPSGGTSATTFLSVMASGSEATICWLGNSRSYWLAETPAQSYLLTLDDSVANEMIEAGLAGETEATASPDARKLTRWLGGETAGLAGHSPHVVQYAPPNPGALLICSDGLWNYLPEAADLSRLALPKVLTDPLSASRDLVRFAIDAGGADNITAVLIPYPAPDAPDP
jgi:serine/threonine protein phosphatase PrpC